MNKLEKAKAVLGFKLWLVKNTKCRIQHGWPCGSCTCNFLSNIGLNERKKEYKEHNKPTDRINEVWRAILQIREPYEIVSIKNKDTSVNYILLGSPKPIESEVIPKTRIETYHDDQGYEHIREISDIPIQQNLI